MPRRTSGASIVGVRLSCLSILLVWTTVIGACQPLPRPFQPEGKIASLNGYLEPGPRAGLVVASPSGLSRQRSEHIAALVAESLRDRGIAATVNASERRRYRLQGYIEREEDPFSAPEDARTIVLRWSLVDLEGDVVGAVTQHETVAPRAWRDPTEATLRSFAARAAPRIEDMINGYGASPIPLRPFDAVVVYGVDGAPGDGAVALRRGMQRALRLRRVPVVESITDDTYVVLGAVHIDGGPTPRRQTVEIDWTVIRPDGSRVGSVRQRNSVEAGRLDGAWGMIATAAARDGAKGVVSLLEGVGDGLRNRPGKR